MHSILNGDLFFCLVSIAKMLIAEAGDIYLNSHFVAASKQPKHSVARAKIKNMRKKPT